MGYQNSTPIDQLQTDEPMPPIRRYALRFLDRQYLIADGRLISRPRPSLWESLGERQLFLSSLFSEPHHSGPALAATSDIPDRHHFRGRGSKDIVPLYRNSESLEPNVLPGLIEMLGISFSNSITPEDLTAYFYGIMAHPEYPRRFYEELDTRQVRVPITKDAALFEKIRSVGARLLWLHTYGQRYVQTGQVRGQVPNGKAKGIKAVPQTEEDYPKSFHFEANSKTLHIGEGQFNPVEPEVFEFEVSGLKVVQSWLRYRMKAGAGKKSSPLDDIRPTVWRAEFNTELLEMLWVLEETVALYPEQAELLEAVVAGECFTAGELPDVPEGMRKPPKPPVAEAKLL